MKPTSTQSAIPLLEVGQLRKTFGGVKAVDGISFSMNAGQMLAIIGPNGAGKTTCFNLLNGQLRPDAGKVRFLGQDVTGVVPRKMFRLGVGRTFQVAEAFTSMTVRENVQLALISYHRKSMNIWMRAKRAFCEEADILLEQVGLIDQAGRGSSILAYGDLKRLDLAIALAHSPRLVLMDEPTAGMASKERVALMELTEQLVRARNVGVLFTEHDMDVVFRHADEILVLHRGRVIAQGKPNDIKNNQEVKEIYFGSRVKHAA